MRSPYHRDPVVSPCTPGPSLGSSTWYACGMTPSQKHLFSRFFIGFTLFSAVGLAVLVAAEVYIRWTLNQNFTLLGGNGLPSLALLVLGLMLGQTYLVSREK